MKTGSEAHVARTWKLCLTMALGLPLTSGCASFLSPPSVEIVGVELVAVGLTEGLAEVTLEVGNEGMRDLNVRGIIYDLQVNTAEEAT